jgi:hypothetical protein
MKLFFEHSGQRIEFELIYRSRKSIGIKISPKDGIIIHSPKGIKPDDIIKTLKTKSSWILKKLDEVKNIKKTVITKKFINGEKLLFLGEEHSLEIFYNPNIKNTNISIDYGKIILESKTDNADRIKNHLEQWYKIKGLEIILERIFHYQPFFTIKPNVVKVKTQKSRWGTCNSKKNLYFNWKIIMAPIEIVDYLVVHEMAHLVHMNHSSKFWNFVEKILPDYKSSRKILKKNGHIYTF